MGTTPIAALRRLRDAGSDGRLDTLCECHGLRVLGAFGSALNTSDPHDLDIAALFVSNDFDLIGLYDDLTQLSGCDVLDIAVLNGAPPTLRARALCGLGLYEREAGDYAIAQMAALAEYRDTAPLRRLELERLAG